MNPTVFHTAGEEQSARDMGAPSNTGQWLHASTMHHMQGPSDAANNPPFLQQQQSQYRHDHQAPSANVKPPSPRSQSAVFVQKNSQPFAHLQGQHGSPPASWDMQKVLNLYIHDYCLKNNFVKAANAIAADTGVRTDEGVPMGKDAPGGLLVQWFTQFWANFANNGLTPTSAEQSRPAAGRMFQQQQQQQQGLPSFMTSSSMRRTETEPLKKAASVSDFKGGSLRGSYMSVDDEVASLGALGMRFKSTTAPWEAGPSDPSSKTYPQTDPPHGLSRAASHDIAILMQKMGCEKQSYENLSLDEKNALIGVLKRSQEAQHQALERMAQNIPPTSMETSANRGVNGTAFQQGPLPLSLPSQQQQQQQQIFHPSQQSPRLPSPQRQSSASTSKKSPGAASATGQRKKQRSSVNQQAISQLQPQLQSPQQQTSMSGQAGSGGAENPKRGSGGLIPSPNIVDQPSMSSSEAARKVEEQQALARRLQLQSQGIISQTAPPTSTSMDWNTQSSPNGNSMAHQAQTEAASFATSQVNAQIAQMQSQMSRQGGSKANAQMQSSQISQLKILQGKLSQSAKVSNEGEWNKHQHQHQHQQQQQPHPNQGQTHRGNSGEMGPPPSPGSASFFNQHAMSSSASSSYPPADASHNGPFSTAHSAPGTPALTTSSSLTINTPDWRDTLSRPMQESPSSYMQYTHSFPPSQAGAAHNPFGSMGDPSHMESMAGKSFHHHPPPPGSSVGGSNFGVGGGDHAGQQQSGNGGGNLMNSMSNPFHNFDGMDAATATGQGSQGLDYTNFDWNGTGTMS